MTKTPAATNAEVKQNTGLREIGKRAHALSFEITRS